MRLDPAAAAAGIRLLAYETLASTNMTALALAERGGNDRAPLWVTAQQQTAGRGRRGRVWQSPPGNLYATLLLIDPAPALKAPQVSFVAGLAIFDAVAACAPALAASLALKWPNDLICGGAKLAGILIEGQQSAAGFAVAVGIGVNCASHPSDTSYPATSMAAQGAAVAVADLFAALSATMLRRIDQWRRGDGFAAICSDWLDRAAGIGGEMLVRLADRELSGRCEALDAQGRLLLRLADGSLETVTAGEVFPLGERTPALAVPARQGG